MAPIRLLNARDLKLKVFGGFNSIQVPPYAILSHVWYKEDNQEILFRDLGQVHADLRSDVRNFEALDKTGDMSDVKASHSKIMGVCEEALRHNIEWVWIDSCCINK